MTESRNLAYEHKCLVEAERGIVKLFEAIEGVADEWTKRNLTLSLANVADQVSDAECGVRRHLGLPEPETGR